jgi:hypothetical protein
MTRNIDRRLGKANLKVRCIGRGDQSHDGPVLRALRGFNDDEDFSHLGE